MRLNQDDPDRPADADKHHFGSPPPRPSVRRNSEGTGDVVDSRRPASTLKTTGTMQIEYSPGPLTATQSLMSLRRRLTRSIDAPKLENPLHFARAPHGIGATINNESSPSFESVLEEKSIFEQVTNKISFLTSLRRQNSKLENCLMSSLSERLEWLRLNNSLGQSNVLESSGETNQGKDATTLQTGCSTRKLEEDEEDRQREVKRLKDCDSLQGTRAVRGRCKRPETRRASFCDRLRAKTDPRRTMMGLTLPMGKFLLSMVSFLSGNQPFTGKTYHCFI